MNHHYVRGLASTAASLLIATALLVAACGGSEESTASADTSLGESGSIAFEGLVDYPGMVTVLDLDYMYWVTITADHPEVGPTEYEGVPLSDIFSYVGVQADATTLVITASDGSTVEVALADINTDEAIIAVADDGTMSTVMPGTAAEAWVDDVVQMDFK